MILNLFLRIELWGFNLLLALWVSNLYLTTLGQLKISYDKMSSGIYCGLWPQTNDISLTSKALIETPAEGVNIFYLQIYKQMIIISNV